MADHYSERASKGQAYNLAILTAIADGKHHDNEYIAKQFLRHLQFAALMQKANPQQLAELLNSTKMLELIKEMDKALDKNL